MFLGGGFTKNFGKDKSSLLSSVHCFDLYSESWRERPVEGAPPSGIYTGASASSGQCLYIFGGDDGSACHNSLHQLDTSSATLNWIQLSTPDTSSGPMKKSNCGIIAYGSRLVVFGGYGSPCGPTQPGAEFVKNDDYTDGRGWSNELHVFDVMEGEHADLKITTAIGHFPSKFAKWPTTFQSGLPSWPTIRKICE